MPKIEPQWAAVAAIIVVSVVIAMVYVPGSSMLGNGSTRGSIGANSTGSSLTGSSSTSLGSGSFSVLMTDPPTVPSGVKDLFMSYDRVGVHVAGQANSSGWIVLTESGTIDLMQAINVSQTIATTNLQNGQEFNALGFNITNVVVTYDNGSVTANYTADLVYGQNRLFVAIPGGITVNSSVSQAVMIDMTPKVLLLGSTSDPTFAFLPSARGYVVPNGFISAQSHPLIGERVSLQGNHWWQSVLANTSFSLASVVVSENGLSITVSNNGAVPIVFHFVAVSSDISVAGGEMPLPAVSDIFVVEPNATLAQLDASSNSTLVMELAASGYLLAPGGTVSFTYKGSVALGWQSYVGTQFGRTAPIVSGESYIVRLFSNGFVAAAGTTAIANITTA